MSPGLSDRADPTRGQTSHTSGHALRARAPGKLMLAGEYSVLRVGGLAVAVAVPYGVEIVAVPASRWEIHRDDAASWREGDPSVPEELRFVHAALERSLEVFPSLVPRRLSARSLSDVGQGTTKPGVGGSASATVATCALLNDATGDPAEKLDDTALLARVIAAHRAGQDGQGSGYDVATILRGGLVAFRRQRAVPPRAETHLWPKDFRILAGYSGRSASTTRQLQKVRRLAETHAEGLARELEILGAPV
ncbi:MAG: hypothetical protein KAI47_01970, partial [Deltaproteobacteria bacterium]|nr:hypothetical protein [Deltaproteobacteria bacterium]